MKKSIIWEPIFTFYSATVVFNIACSSFSWSNNNEHMALSGFCTKDIKNVKMSRTEKIFDKNVSIKLQNKKSML